MVFARVARRSFSSLLAQGFPAGEAVWVVEKPLGLVDGREPRLGWLRIDLDIDHSTLDTYRVPDAWAGGRSAMWCLPGHVIRNSGRISIM